MLKKPAGTYPPSPVAEASNHSVAIAGDNSGPIHIGLDAETAERRHQELLSAITADKGVPEAPLQAVLVRLGEEHVPRDEIPAKLAAAADELVRLRADLARLQNDRPEFAAIRARALALIDKGDFAAAKAALREGQAAAKALREEISRTEAAFLADVARLDRLQFNYDAAKTSFAEAARLDPQNVWLWIELGDLWLTLGSLTEAEKAYQSAIKAAVDSKDQRDLAASYDRIGDIRQAQGKLPDALTAFENSRAIRQTLAKADPGNAQWQRDLSVSHNKIGDIRQAQGNLTDALTAFENALAISQTLAKADPGNAQWQRDLAVSYGNMGKIHWQLRNKQKALEYLQKGREIVIRLADLSPDDAQLPKDLAIFDGLTTEVSAMP